MRCLVSGFYFSYKTESEKLPSPKVVVKGNGDRVYNGINTENAPPHHAVPLSSAAPPPVSATSFSAGNCGQDILSRKIPEIKNS